MRLCSLASGSKGNAYLVGEGGDLVLIDCGIGPRTLSARLAAANVAPGEITAMLVTHEHSDHVGGLAAFQRLAPEVPVYMNLATANAVCEMYEDIREETIMAFENESPFAIGGLEVVAFPVSHDVSDPVGFFVSGEGGAYFHVTDTGEATQEMAEFFGMADLATLESNHDLPLLRASGRPYHLVRRIEGPRGHLSNDQAAEFAAEFISPRLKHLSLAHLSQDCNAPHLALKTMADSLVRAGSGQTEIKALSQCRASEWIYA